ncbi:MAG TPA: glycosyltransferase, partial [Tetrasphaera sp.]|uniref:glycosyltransferase family 2 protein n=1 Tax=Nostocoides sp. TaxID=1917966 RepID=UPI002B897AA8
MTATGDPGDPRPRVSVIVPVYNVRNFVVECLASITSQTHRNLQIIVVDDGSTDGSGETCDQLGASDPRIEVIHQANAGLSGARNTGLDRATGGYVTLVDGDDLVAPDFVATLLADCLAHDADLAVTGFVPFDHEHPRFRVEETVEVLRTPEELEQLVTGLPPKWEGPTKLYRA